MKVLIVRGELIVWSRPTTHDVIDVTDYRRCPYCLAFVIKKEMWRDVKLRPANTGEDDSKSLKKSELLLFPNKYYEEASEELKMLVLSSMFNDDKSSVVFKDQVITTLGSFLLSPRRVRRGNHKKCDH